MEELLQGLVPVDRGADGERGQVEDPLEGRPAGEKVEGVPEEDGLRVGDRLHPGDVAHDLRLFLQERARIEES